MRSRPGPVLCPSTNHSWSTRVGVRLLTEEGREIQDGQRTDGVGHRSATTILVGPDSVIPTPTTVCNVSTASDVYGPGRGPMSASDGRRLRRRVWTFPQYVPVKGHLPPRFRIHLIRVWGRSPSFKGVGQRITGSRSGVDSLSIGFRCRGWSCGRFFFHLRRDKSGKTSVWSRVTFLSVFPWRILVVGERSSVVEEERSGTSEDSA